MAGYDTFVGLPLDQSIAGAAMDSGGLNWGTHTYLAGDGNGSVKISGLPNGFAVIGNVVLPATANAVEVMFKAGASASGQAPAIQVMMHGDGSASSQYGAGGIVATVDEYGVLKCKNLADGAEVTAAYALDRTADKVIRIEIDPVDPKKYYARIYSVTGGARNATPDVSTNALTLAAARPATARLSQILKGGAPALTISRYEWFEPAAGTGATINLVGANCTQANGCSTGAVTINAAPASTVTSPVFRGFDGLPKAGLTVENVVLTKLDRTPVLSLANQVTNGAGRLVITNAALVAGTSYMLASWSADGSLAGNKKVTAA